jgi:hypothetical protein
VTAKVHATQLYYFCASMKAKQKHYQTSIKGMHPLALAFLNSRGSEIVYNFSVIYSLKLTFSVMNHSRDLYLVVHPKLNQSHSSIIL